MTIQDHDLQLLLISNDYEMNHSPARWAPHPAVNQPSRERLFFKRRTHEALLNLGFVPTLILLGSVNHVPGSTDASMDEEEREAVVNQHIHLRFQEHTRRFPHALVVPYFGAGHTGSGCRAEGLDCGDGGGHQCFPGPIIQNAQSMAEELIELSRF